MRSQLFTLLGLLGSVVTAVPCPQASGGGSATATSSTASPSSSASANGTINSVDNTVLILARDDYGVSSAAAGLIAYGIPYKGVTVPQTGATLPPLNSSLTDGNFGGIIIMDALAYSYTDGWRSAITTDQWNTIHAYQTQFHVRMVRINEYPGPDYGATVVGGGCCGNGVEQLISFTDTSDFPTANLKTNAGITSQGLYHYSATITDTTNSTKQVAKWGPGGDQSGDTTAAVINNWNGREQFVWFTSWAPDWSVTSAYLQHAHIHWMTRGVFLGKRKTHLSAQVDDLQLQTDIYKPANTTFKIRVGDLNGIVAWQKNINGRMPQGSDFWLEFAHNGNGDIEAATNYGDGSVGGVCKPDYAVEYDEILDTPLEFQKPLGTGEDKWPTEFTTYPWSLQCAQKDAFASWFNTAANLNAFAHLSHTFTHMEMNNATGSDAAKEIQFNRAWMKQMGIDKATRYSTGGLVPPAITGLHNGDVIKAWMDNGIKHVVGDNTRPVLRNTQSMYWPLKSTVANNGYDGLNIIPRYATTIYYNCDTADCTTSEWINTSGGSGDFQSLLQQAKTANARYLFGLQADPYMFHQANLRQTDMPTITVGTQTGKFAIISAWIEIVAQELIRLTNWPITSLKHDDIGQYFLDRQALDQCQPTLKYGYASDGKSITSVTVGTANGNTCSVPVPVTIPSGTVSGGTVKADVVGSEPPIQWVTLSGSPVTLNLGSAVAIKA